MSDDFADAFLAHSAETDADARIAAEQALQAARAAPQPAGTAPAPDQQQAAAVPPAALPGAAAPTQPSSAPAGGKSGRSWGRAVLDAAVDVPTQIPGGAMEAVGQMAGALDDLGNWLNRHVADLKFDLPSSGSETIDAVGRALLGNPLASAKADLTGNLPPRTALGGIERSVAQFLTGFALNRKLLGGAAIGTPGGYATALGAGAMTDAFAFDPQAGNLANLIESVPALSNPVTRFLAAGPEDSDALARLKNAVTGALPGLAVDGVVAGIRFYKARAAARAAQTAATEATGAGAAGPASPVSPPSLGTASEAAAATDNALGARIDADLSTLGPRDGPLFTAAPPPPPTPKQQIGKAVAEAAPQVDAAKGAADVTTAARAAAPAGGLELPGGFRVNVNAVEGGDDLKAVLTEMVRRHADEVNQARRGTVSHAETRATASQTDAFAVLVKRRQGSAVALNDAELTAVKDLWVASADKLMRVAATAAENPSEGALAAYQKMEAFHRLVQDEFFGARAEAGRALQALRIPSGSGQAQLRAIGQILDDAGGPGVVRAKAAAIAALSHEGAPPLAVEAAIAQAGRATTFDMVREFYVNGLLWLPTTHAANFVSNASVLANQVYERWSAEKVAQLVGASGGVQPGEAAAMLDGIGGAFRDALRLTWKAIKSGEQDPFGLGGKVEFTPAIGAKGFGLSEKTFAGTIADVLGATVRTPGQALAASDTFFKTLNYRAALHAYAVRQAAAEGLTDPKAYAARIGELIASPSEAVRLAAQDDALLATFTNKTGEWGKGMMLARQKIPPLAFVLPFVKTPLNIARYAFERNVLTAPFVRQWREDILAGGARRQLALARTAGGTMLLGTAVDLADRGLISGNGPDDPGERGALTRQGWQPYSIRIGDRWYSYQRADPAGMVLGFGADLADLSRRYQIEPEEVDSLNEVIASAIFAAAQVTINKTYLSGLAQAVDAISNPDMAGPGYVARFTGSFIPNIEVAAQRLADPTVRDTTSLSDYLQSRLVGLSQRLPPRLDLWGEELSRASGLGPLYDAAAPFAARPVKDSPADAEMQRLNLNIQDIPNKISFEGVPVDLGNWPAVKYAYRKLAGNALKDPGSGLGAKDLIDQMVQGKGELGDGYRRLPDGDQPGTKGATIANIITRYRAAARAQILNDPKFSDFRDFIVSERAALAQRAEEAANQ